MTKRICTYILYPVLVVGITIGLFSVVYAGANSNIDPENRHAWSANAGWVNFNPSHGGVMVYDDHLEGYAWAENVGWIRLGTHTGGGSHTYGNTSAADYGVNRAGDGALSGYAWGTNVGWINFSPTHGGMTVDAKTGDFYGYAWGENIGWIHLSSTAPVPYGVSMVMHHVYLPLVLRSQ